VNCYPFIEAEKQGDHNVKRACELLQVSRSAYYADRTSGPSSRAERDAVLTGKIVEIHDDSRHTWARRGSTTSSRPKASGAPASGSPG
jgi:hypothetical protein